MHPYLSVISIACCCIADVLLSMNISDDSGMVSLTPALRRPDVPGIRVEVNGQVSRVGCGQ